MAYFDNAATTYPKPECVYKKMDEFYRSSGANAGRGNYKLAQSAGALIGETRILIQELLHCPAKQVVFEPTATIALNLIIQGIIKNGAANIYISPFEHNAVTRTLHYFEKEGRIKVKQLTVSEGMEYDLERTRYQFDAVKPDFVIISHASNVFGLVAPVEEIFALAKKYNAITLVDMAQTAGLVDLNVGLSTIDFAVFSGHKTLYGPTGISGFVMDPSVKFPSILFGGTGYESANQDMPESLPQKYEMGTLNISGIAGLNAALKWERGKTIEVMWEKEQEHRERLINLLERYSFIKIVGSRPGCKYVGIVSALIDGISSDSAGPIFDRCHIAVRTGLQCAPLAHQFMGTYPAGTIRFSVNYFTAEKDFTELKQALDYIEMEL
ncbi:MAG: aminotransferase class V-fold PLP-dependent enzyme [Oscillospiraceae bacterium]|jgi:cysteine desulfurase family protein|nr:aminotransferase class V-fold PLP-dependent enzyme [Oscillospiraceae bacterium]